MPDPMACGTGTGVGSVMAPLSRVIVGGEQGDDVAGIAVVSIPLVTP